MSKEAFTVSVPDAVLTDLRERLAKARWPGEFANEQWAYGTNQAYLRNWSNTGAPITTGARMNVR